MNAYFEVVSVLFLYYLLQFIVGQIKKNNSIVDIFWGSGFVVAICFALFRNKAYNLTSLIVAVLVCIWGVRLSYHIGKRNIGKPEDFRYVNFRKKWGDKWVPLKAFLQVYMLQFLMLLMIASAGVAVILKNPSSFSLISIIGILTWCVGFYFESRADKTLKDFKSNPANKGKILTSGLYKYSRHPNYFGEAMMWWGIFLIGFTHIPLYFVISPLTITILVRYVSGVPMLEKHYEDREDFKEYARKTSIFVPWFPKK